RPSRQSRAPSLTCRQWFTEAKCQNCHGGAQWSVSKLRYTPAPDASLINAGQILNELRAVGSFDASASNEVRQNAAAPLGAAGFNPPSLLGLHAFPRTFMHNGSIDSLEAVMALVPHRASGTAGVDTLTDANKRRQLIRFLLSIDASTPVINPDTATPLGITNSASYTGNEGAPLAAAASFGAKLASKVVGAASAALPVTLDGSTVTLRDSAGLLKLARLYFVSPGQINFEVPAGLASGTATATVYTATGELASGNLTVGPVAPGLFSMSGDGKGIAAVTAIRVNADQTQSPVELFRCTANGCIATPVDVASGPVFLSLFGTGIRGRAILSGVRCTVGGVDLPVLFAGPQGAPGLDQVNVELPATLRGRGEVPVILTVDGKVANTVTLTIQ
ncbi:MAG: hypothetical protein NTW74_12765, partial [Acidobacteria bacterium]|nr:hypothetical protein [Acidobacteriota bacterium]